MTLRMVTEENGVDTLERISIRIASHKSDVATSSEEFSRWESAWHARQTSIDAALVQLRQLLARRMSSRWS